MSGFVSSFKQKGKGLCLALSQVNKGVTCEFYGRHEREGTASLI